MSWGKIDGEEKCQILTSGMYSSYQAGVSRSGTNLVIVLEGLCSQTNLFWREMKINKMYTEI